MYGFNHRFHDSIQYARKLIESKKFGKIINLRGVYGKSYIVLKTKFSKKQNYKFNWRTRKKRCWRRHIIRSGYTFD